MQNQPFFMVGTHNMHLVVLECMQILPISQDIVSVGATLLFRFIGYISNLVHALAVTNEEAFAGGDISAIQRFLLRCMEEFELDHDITICLLKSLLYVVGGFLAHMRRNKQCLGTAVRALMIHLEHEEVVDFAIDLIAGVLPNFWCPLTGVANTPSAKTRMKVNVMVPVLVGGLRVAQFSATSKTICSRLISLLCLLCQNHPSNAHFIANNRILNILTATFRGQTVPNVDQQFEQLHGSLQALLASFVVALPSGTDRLRNKTRSRRNGNHKTSPHLYLVYKDECG